MSVFALVRKILFLPRENKIHIFKPLCNILYIYIIFVTLSITIYECGRNVSALRQLNTYLWSTMSQM